MTWWEGSIYTSPLSTWLRPKGRIWRENKLSTEWWLSWETKLDNPCGECSKLPFVIIWDWLASEKAHCQQPHIGFWHFDRSHTRVMRDGSRPCDTISPSGSHLQSGYETGGLMFWEWVLPVLIFRLWWVYFGSTLDPLFQRPMCPLCGS